MPRTDWGQPPHKNAPPPWHSHPPVHPAPLRPVAPEGPSTWLRSRRCAGETLTFPASGTRRELSAAPRGSLKARRAAAVIALIYLLTAGAEGRGMWHSLPLWEPYGTHLSPFAAAGQGEAAAPVNSLLTLNFSHHPLLQERRGHGAGGLGRGPGRGPQSTAPTGHSTHLPFPTHGPSWQRYSSTQCPRPSPPRTGQGAAGMLQSDPRGPQAMQSVVLGVPRMQSMRGFCGVWGLHEGCTEGTGHAGCSRRDRSAVTLEHPQGTAPSCSLEVRSWEHPRVGSDRVSPLDPPAMDPDGVLGEEQRG